jgi:2-polyprenyl-3-methyl-5-hydroxy-6-metoxy-1,4-benzoquinol methylase
MPLVVDPDGVEAATIRELVAADGLDAVDAGCGDGRLSFELARQGASVFGIDPDEESIALARSETPRALRRRVRFEVADAAQIELPRGEFDLALFSWSL